MTVYTVFLCIAAMNQCQLLEQPHYDIQGEYVGTRTYASLAECRHSIPPQPGRPGFRYVCLGKHVDTWH
jgi:hypothetical protein